MELFMSDKTSLHYYVNMPGNTLPGTSFSTITEALTALTDSSCLSCEKQFPALVSDLPPVIVHIGGYLSGKINHHQTKCHLRRGRCRQDYSRLRRCRL